MAYRSMLNQRNFLIAAELFRMIIENPLLQQDEENRQLFERLLEQIAQSQAYKFLFSAVKYVVESKFIFATHNEVSA